MRGKMPIPKYRRKIFQLLNQIEDSSFRSIITEVVSVEFENRGSHHFPIKKIEDAVDNEATLIEQQNNKGSMI